MEADLELLPEGWFASFPSGYRFAWCQWLEDRHEVCSSALGCPGMFLKEILLCTRHPLPAVVLCCCVDFHRAPIHGLWIGMLTRA